MITYIAQTTVGALKRSAAWHLFPHVAAFNVIHIVHLYMQITN